ncbi:hypothetical protein [Aquisalimonas asiatica]|uniref:Uncharacterized protein n=1 Tax=Aquisalimonas asiatica TaxID=406100 RepID=A0A1H8VAJ7_9GAMM|nr:hypothetical protein [Aquisalimonas asiatica]SEP12449.1 hypothetical protein SAMN04488052_11111 [Aquisalimonas asiatica]
MELDWTLGLVLLGMGATAALVVRSRNGSNTVARSKRASSEPNPQEAAPSEPDVEPTPEPADLTPPKAGAPRPHDGPEWPDDGRGDLQLNSDLMALCARLNDETIAFLDWLADADPAILAVIEECGAHSLESLREDSRVYWENSEQPDEDVGSRHRELLLDIHGVPVDHWMLVRAAWLQRREDLDALERVTKLAVDQVRVMRLRLEAMQLSRLDPELRVWEIPEDALIGALVHVVAVDGAISERDVAFLNGVFEKDLSADDYVRMYGSSERGHEEGGAIIDFLESVGRVNGSTSADVNMAFLELTMLAIAAGEGHDGEKLARRGEILDAGREVMHYDVFPEFDSSGAPTASENETDMVAAQSRIDALRQGVPG